MLVLLFFSEAAARAGKGKFHTLTVCFGLGEQVT